MSDLHVSGVVDRDRCAELKAQLRCAMASTRDLQLWLDDVTAIDAGGVECLIVAKLSGAELGVTVRIAAASYPVRASLRRLRLDGFLGLEG